MMKFIADSTLKNILKNFGHPNPFLIIKVKESILGLNSNSLRFASEIRTLNPFGVKFQ